MQKRKYEDWGSKMKLKAYLETIDDLEAWGKQLEGKTKGELIEFILIKAMGDPKFQREV